MVETPYCEGNEKNSKNFLKTFSNFAGENFRKIWPLFPVKEKNLYPSCEIYCAICDCGKDASETEKNTKTRWSKHNPEHNSEPARYIMKNIDHILTWII